VAFVVVAFTEGGVVRILDGELEGHGISVGYVGILLDGWAMSIAYFTGP
jgi:hypothetical protein